MFGIVLLTYAIGQFIYFYKTSGGASGVAVHHGEYVSMYKEHTIRVISKEEYLFFPTLWTRVMSAWLGMMTALLWADIDTRSKELTSRL